MSGPWEVAAPVPAKKHAPSPGQATGKKANQPKRITNNMISDQLAALAAQMQLLSQRQDSLEKHGLISAADVPEQYRGPSSKLPAVSAGLRNPSGVSQTSAMKAMSLIGPPPKVKAAPQVTFVEDAVQDEPYDLLQPTEDAGGIVAALTRQSTAITAVVAHLAPQSGDVLGDLTSTGSQMSTTKGVQRRERMQSDLACGTSQYFLQVMQQLHRRLNPSKPVPATEEALQGLSVLQYLERQGGYRGSREMGLVPGYWATQWMRPRKGTSDSPKRFWRCCW